ncbi:MAG: pantetheine-phosphate adenylyltransferase [Chitinophagales bacterium]|nr:pantetheine-phosphate adenylyltransferase [Bacteroidota bacterium]MCB9042260.1 pantetheine-phosphate adenylyltransferase [Chitinophagales bacterium]
MSKTAIFPGTFDPITIGHYEIVQRALPIFDKIIVAIGHNTQKKTLLPVEERQRLINILFEDTPQVSCEIYQGLTAEYCKQSGVFNLIRGLRSAADFDYEKQIAQLNKALDTRVETIFLISSPHFSHISSSIVREIMLNKGDARNFIPEKIREYFVPESFS